MAFSRAQWDGMPPQRPSGWRRLLSLWPAPVAVAFVAVVIAAAVAGFSAFLAPDYRNIIAIGEGSCSVDASSDNAWVAIPMRADSYGVDWYVKRVVGNGATVVGLATLGQGQSIDSLDAGQRDGLRGRLQNKPDNEWVRVTDEPVTAVIAFERTSDDAAATIDEVVLWWSHGEPAGLQRVALNLVWSGGECSVTTHELPEVDPTLNP